MNVSDEQKNTLNVRMFNKCPNCGTLIVVGKQCPMCKKKETSK